MGFRLINAKERQREFPETFELPSLQSVAALKVGDYVKIGVEIDPNEVADASGERFWVLLSGIATDGDHVRFTGVIHNDLRLTPCHGLKRDDAVAFEACHVLSVNP